MKSLVVWFASGCAVLLGASVAAQAPPSVFDTSYAPPRLESGKPDLQGLWSNALVTPLERPADLADKEFLTEQEAREYQAKRVAAVNRDSRPDDAAADILLAYNDFWWDSGTSAVRTLRTSLIVDPPNGMLPPLLPAAQARKAARPKRSLEDPETFGLAERCLMGIFGASGGSLASPPMIPSDILPSLYKIVQNDTHVLIFTEWVHDARIVRLNGMHLPSSIRSWLGDSIGHYEGDTLVVDTTNFRKDTHYLDSGERLHVVERFTRVDPTTLRYRVTVEDPDTWATPWTAEWPFTATDVALFPVECHEGNYSMENMLKGARAEEQRAQTTRR